MQSPSKYLNSNQLNSEAASEAPFNGLLNLNDIQQPSVASAIQVKDAIGSELDEESKTDKNDATYINPGDESIEKNISKPKSRQAITTA